MNRESSKVVPLNVWQKNTNLYPSPANRQIDVMDKNKTLVKLKEVTKEIELQMQYVSNGATQSLNQSIANFNNIITNERHGQSQNGADSNNASPELIAVKGKQLMLLVEDNEFIQQAL